VAHTLLDRVPLEHINRQAKEVHPGRTVLTWIAAVLFAVGWVACKVLGLLWLAAAWSFVAMREGWREARSTGGTGRPG
jgi:hypothetical protein